MSFLKNKWALVSMAFFVWALIASLFAGYYWLQYNDIVNRIGGVAIYVNIGIDYGNNTRIWHNNTKALTGMTLFKITKSIANVEYDTAAGFGVYVKSINGLSYNASHGWVWWKWDGYMLNWTRIDISSDAYSVADNEIFLWYYESGWPPPPPP
ncbi:MAG: hypothetical protein QW468_05190 [Candidatus Bathyarchaeia archaeon]